MKRHRWMLLITILMCTAFAGVSAQTDTVTQYGSQAIAWRLDAAIDYAAGPAEGTNLFISVATDAEGNIYVANLNNVLVIDGETGETIDTIFDESGTIQQYSDVAVAADGTLWIADNRSRVYRVDASGTILTTVAFEPVPPGFTDERNPGRIEVDPDGNLYVNYSGFGIFFQVFSPEGEYIRSIITGAGRLSGVNHFTFAADGTLFFQGAGIGWITEEDGQAVVHEFAAEFMEQQAFIQFYGIAMDDAGNIYFSAGADGDSGVTIFQLDSEGTLIGQYGRGQERARWADEFGTDEIGHTAALAFAADGSLIIADINNTNSKLTKLTIQHED